MPTSLLPQRVAGQRGAVPWVLLAGCAAALAVVGWLVLGSGAHSGDEATSAAEHDAPSPSHAGPTLNGRREAALAPTPEREDGQFFIPGQVVDERGRPLAGVAVRARRHADAYRNADARRYEWRPAAGLDTLFRQDRDGPDASPPAAAAGVSGADGTFRLEVRRWGEYRVEAEPEAPLVGTTETWYLNDHPPRTPLTLRVVPGSHLRGRVVDAEDRGVSAVLRASWYDPAMGTWAAEARSTVLPAGAFSFPAVPAGKLHLDVNVPGRVRLAGAVVETPTDREILIRLGTGGTLLGGSVRDLAGQAVAGAQVAVTLRDLVTPGDQGEGEAPTSLRYLALSGPDGRYELGGGFAGRVGSVEVSARGYLYLTQSPPLAPWTGLTLAVGREATLDLTLYQGGSVSGRVLEQGTGAPLGGATLRAHPLAVDGRLTRPPPVTAVSDAQGRYRLEGVPMGRSLLVVEHPTHWFPALESLARANPSQTTFFDGSAGAAAPPPNLALFVEREGQALTRDVELSQGLPVSGRVVDEAGRPVVGADVRAKGLGLGQRAWQWGLQTGQGDRTLATSDEEGRFHVPGLPPRSDWVLYAMKPPLLGVACEAFELSAQRPQPELVLSLRTGGTLAGRVLDESGASVVGAWVQAWPASIDGSFLFEGQVRADAEGRFRIPGLPPGTVNVFATAPSGGGGQQQQVENLLPGEVREGIEVTLAKGHEVSGVLVDESGVPLRGRTLLLLSRHGGHLAQTTTQQGGSFTLRTTETDGVRLMGGPHDDAVELATLKAPAADLRVTWREPPQHVIEGLVVDAQGKPVPLCTVSLSSSRPDAEANRFYQAAGGGLAVNGWFRRQARGQAPFQVQVSQAQDGEGRPLNLRARTVTVSEVPCPALTITLEPGTSVSGRVLDGSDRGVAGVSVSVGSVRTETDAEGGFVLSGLEGGALSLEVRPPRPYVKPPFVATTGGATNVLVRLTSGLAVAGQVLRPDATPATNGWINVSWPGRPGHAAGSQGASLSPEGRWRVEGLPEGAVATVMVQLFAQRGEQQVAPTIVKDVRAGTEDMVIRLVAGVEVEGLVLTDDGKPFQGGGHVLTHPGREGSDGAAWHELKSDGTFRAVNVPAGPLRLRVQRRDGGAVSPPLLVEAPTRGVRLVLPPSTPIRGRLVLSGEDATRFRVHAWQATAPQARARASVAADGTFSLDAIAGEGTWMVGASAPDDDRYALAGPVAGGTEGLTLNLRTGRTIEGMLRGADGSTPPAGSFVSASGNGWTVSARCEASGDFRLRGLPPGRYTLAGRTPDDGARTSQPDVEDGAHGLTLTLVPTR